MGTPTANSEPMNTAREFTDYSCSLVPGSLAEPAPDADPGLGPRDDGVSPPHCRMMSTTFILVGSTITTWFCTSVYL